MYTVMVPEKVAKQIRDMPKRVQAKIVRTLATLENNPRPHNIVAYQGRENTY